MCTVTDRMNIIIFSSDTAPRLRNGDLHDDNERMKKGQFAKISVSATSRQVIKRAHRLHVG